MANQPVIEAKYDHFKHFLRLGLFKLKQASSVQAIFQKLCVTGYVKHIEHIVWRLQIKEKTYIFLYTAINVLTNGLIGYPVSSATNIIWPDNNNNNKTTIPKYHLPC